MTTSAGRWNRPGIWLLAALLTFERAEAQGQAFEFRQVRWPLLDIVMVPDSAGLWFMAAPNPSTTQWESGSHLVRLEIDPVLALQWATVARKLVSLERRLAPGQPAHFTPPLRARRGSTFVVLATNPKKPSARTRFVLLVSDSVRNIRWKSLASSDQVDGLLTALEGTATASRDGSPAVWNTLADGEPDTPVNVVSQPRPVYPARLASSRRVGRVWMSYIVSAEGRAQQGSFVTLLSDDSLFTEAAVKALLGGRYQPAVANGVTVSQRVFQAILFRRQ
jgi:hypothetical protein